MTVKYQGSEAHHFNITEARKKAYTKKECPFCKVSMSSGCLAKHVKACLHDDVNRRDCKNCRVRLLDSNKIIFCSRSCSAIFNNNIREQQRVVKQIKCLGCGNKKDHRKSHGLFCNNTCRVDYNRTKTWEKIEAGEINGIGLRSLKRYISEKRGDKCEECGQEPWWNGKPLTLDMDHINGDRANNHLNNLRLLCPNCHTQTSTWGTKKRIVAGL